ncbi:suppressor of fused domain protein [Fusobacterium sp. SB021]|uniref:suppressor of fused domain protein n=1 Tax=Fusobacterium sp. SB021 TaxID=2744227 RepID=UPI003CF29132
MRYTENERIEIIKFIEENFGKVEEIYEIGYDNYYLDVAQINPTKEKPYYTIITLGMGEYKMYNQNNENFSSFAELMISFPSDWNFDDKNYTWAIDELIQLTYIPFTYFFAYEWGHLENNFEPFSSNTKLSAVTLLYPEMKKENSGLLKLENRNLQFYQIVPLYDEECTFALKNGMKNLLLLDVEKKISFVIDMNREKVLEYSEEEKEMQDDIMDSAEWHLGDYYSKGIEVEEINIYNHLAVFLRWAMENSFLSDNFLKAYGKELEKYTSQDFVDLREFVKFRLKGDLRKSFFNDIGKEFIRHYYDYDNTSGNFYPEDIDEYTKRIFGEERYYSPELKREAYLYLTFDEKYYQDMKAVIDDVYNTWLKELDSYIN